MRTNFHHILIWAALDSSQSSSKSSTMVIRRSLKAIIFLLYIHTWCLGIILYVWTNSSSAENGMSILRITWEQANHEDSALLPIGNKLKIRSLTLLLSNLGTRLIIIVSQKIVFYWTGFKIINAESLYSSHYINVLTLLFMSTAKNFSKVYDWVEPVTSPKLMRKMQLKSYIHVCICY
jgi:hypothetical protein